MQLDLASDKAVYFSAYNAYYVFPEINLGAACAPASLYLIQSRKFKVDYPKSDLVKCRSYIQVIFNFFELS